MPLDNPIVKVIENPTNDLPKIITTNIIGEFPKRIGYWSIVKDSLTEVGQGDKSVTITVYLAVDHEGNIRREFRRSVSFCGQTLNTCWGEKDKFNDQPIRYTRVHMPKWTPTEDSSQPKTWTELFNKALEQIQKFSDFLVGIVNEYEQQLKEEL